MIKTRYLVLGIIWAVCLVFGITLSVHFISESIHLQLSEGIIYATVFGVIFTLGWLVWQLAHTWSVDSGTGNPLIDDLFAMLGDGIIVMNPKRVITFINPSAIRLTGWNEHDTIPYCLYCQSRYVRPGEERCLLAAEPKRHYFESQLPTKTGTAVDVGMSRTFLSPSRIGHGRDMVITVRDVSIQKQEEELRVARTLAQHTLEVQEDERRRLSEDLHDGVSQTLYGISLGMEYLHRHIQEPELLKQVEHLHEQLDLSLQEVRSLSRTLYPVALYDIGLLASLRTLADSLCVGERTVQFHTNLRIEENVITSTAVHLYRIVQESIHNAIQHGNATSVHIYLHRQAERLVLIIRDNGSGIDFAKTQASEGYGMRNMQTRTRAMNGILQIRSKMGIGAEIEVIIPVDELLIDSTGPSLLE